MHVFTLPIQLDSTRYILNMLSFQISERICRQLSWACWHYSCCATAENAVAVSESSCIASAMWIMLWSALASLWRTTDSFTQAYLKSDKKIFITYIIISCHMSLLLFAMCIRADGNSTADREISCVYCAIHGSYGWNETYVKWDDVGWSQQSVLEVQQTTGTVLWTAVVSCWLLTITYWSRCEYCDCLISTSSVCSGLLMHVQLDVYGSVSHWMQSYSCSDTALIFNNTTLIMFNF